MYIVTKEYKGLTAYTAKGKIVLDDASQAQLKYLHDMKHQGVIKTEKKKKDD